MLTILLISLLFVLCSIIYQDFKYRAVDIYSLGLFLFFSIIYSGYINGISNAFNSFLPVFCFIVFQLTLLTIIFSIKNKKVSSIFDVYIGWGDIVFWLGLAFQFSIFNFLVFHIFSLLVISFFAIMKKYKTIPLAGGQAFVFTILLYFDYYIFNINHYDDLYLINFLF